MKKNNSKTGTRIKVGYLARVEGEGSLDITVRNGAVKDVKFAIFEPPRFFEAFLRGRKFSEAPDITARICGICPVAYQMSSVHAIESALGIKPSGQLRELRRLLYCGEWLESHALHIFMLHAPDFFGLQDALELAKRNPAVVKNALRIKKAGNAIVELLGGREIHPVNVRVGGFYRVPAKEELAALREELKWSLDASINSLKWLSKLDFPDFERDYNFLSLKHESEYPFNEGRIATSRWLDIPVAEYERHFKEIHAVYTHALHSEEIGSAEPYFTGPLARFNLCYGQLSKTAREAAASIRLKPGCGNPFKSILVRCVEMIYAFDEALRIIKNYERPERPFVSAEPKKSRGCALTEAPRGSLYHRYEIGSDGLITSAKIVPPTSQNQRVIEEDLRRFVPPRLHLSKEKLTWQCEQAVRNYDPCISCATHFLKLKISS